MPSITIAIPRMAPRSMSMKIALGASLLLHAAIIATVNIIPAVGIVGIVFFSAIASRIIGSRSGFSFLNEERQGLINIARSGLDQASYPSYPSGDFLLRADCLGRGNSPVVLDKYTNLPRTAGRTLEIHSKIVGNLLESVPEKDVCRRLEIVFNYVKSTEHDDEQANLRDLLNTRKGNCEARAKLILSLMHHIIKGESKWIPAIALYSNHIDIVLFNTENKKVFDPINGLVEQHETAIFRPELFYYAYLEGQEEKSQKTMADFLLRPPSGLDLADFLNILLRISRGGQARCKKSNSIFKFPNDDKMILPSATSERVRGEGYSATWWHNRYFLYLSSGATVVLLGTAARMTYKAYQHWGETKEACSRASYSGKRPVEFAFFEESFHRPYEYLVGSSWDFTMCPPSFMDSYLSRESRLKPILNRMTRILADGYPKVANVIMRQWEDDPYSIIEFPYAMAPYYLVKERFDDRRSKFNVAIDEQGLYAKYMRKYLEAEQGRTKVLEGIFGTPKGARNLNKLDYLDMVKFVRAISKEELIAGLIDLEELSFDFSLKPFGKAWGKDRPNPPDAADRKNVAGNFGEDDQTKRGMVAFKTVDLPGSLPDNELRNGKADNKDDMTQPGNHTLGTDPGSVSTTEVDLPRSRFDGTIVEVEVVNVPPELNEGLTAPRPDLRKRTLTAPQAAFAPWELLLKLIYAVEEVYPEDGKALTHGIKLRIINDPKAWRGMRERGEDVRRFEEDVNSGGFWLPPEESK